MAAWASGTTYAQRQAATGSDGKTYTSQIDGNIAHDPTLDLAYAFWTPFYNWTGQVTFSQGAHSPGSHSAGAFAPGAWH
jgi:hypothetical protein